MIASLLTHRVNLVRRVALVDVAGDPVLDEDGHAQRTEHTVPNVAAAIQPISTKERAALHQAGATVGTHRIYALERSITTSDFVEHDPDACPLPAGQDLGPGRYELHAVQDAAGLGHHLEIDATLIGPALTTSTAVAAGSGSGS